MKKIIVSFLISLLLITGAPLQGNASVEFLGYSLYNDASLIEYWTLEDLNADKQSFNLTGVNTPTFTAGLFNNAITLNGSSQLANNTNSIFNLTATFTVMAWFNVTSYAGTPIVMMNKLTDNTVGELYAIYINSSGYPYAQTWASSGGFLTLTPTSTAFKISTSTWNHVAFVKAANNDWKFYINGNIASSSSATRSGNTTKKNGIAIGAYDYGVGVANYFPGKIDDAVVFNRPLTATEILNYYNATTTPAATAKKASIINFE